MTIMSVVLSNMNSFKNSIKLDTNPIENIMERDQQASKVVDPDLHVSYNMQV